MIFAGMEYLLHLLILAGIYVMLSQSLNLSAGFGGMISLAHAGFYGVEAYTAALLAGYGATSGGLLHRQSMDGYRSQTIFRQKNCFTVNNLLYLCSGVF